MTRALRAAAALLLSAHVAGAAMAETPDMTPAARAARLAEGGRVLLVGPRRLYRTPSEAARIARDGDTVRIDAATYTDTAIWRAHRLRVEGMGGRPHIIAPASPAEGKAIWVIKGNDVTIENVEMSGARVPDLNGAAIRHEGADLTLRQVHIHDNQMGLLTNSQSDGAVTIEHSVFAANVVSGSAGRFGHNIYIGRIRRFELRYSRIEGARTGHNVKSRAGVNIIAYNRIMDADVGRASYLIDLPDAGAALVIGNVLHQSAASENVAMLAYGSEGSANGARGLRIVHNTFVSAHHATVFVDNASAVPAELVNNLLVGSGAVVNGPARLAGNVLANADVWRALGGSEQAPLVTLRPGLAVAADAGLADAAGYDYRLAAHSPAIDAGAETNDTREVTLEVGPADALPPSHQAFHPGGTEARARQGRPDAGAYEHAPPAGAP